VIYRFILKSPKGFRGLRNAVTVPSRHWLWSIRGRLRPRLIFLCSDTGSRPAQTVVLLSDVTSYEFCGKEFCAKMKKFHHPFSFSSLRRIKVQILPYILFLTAHMNVLLNPDCRMMNCAIHKDSFMWKT